MQFLLAFWPREGEFECKFSQNSQVADVEALMNLPWDLFLLLAVD